MFKTFYLWWLNLIPAAASTKVAYIMSFTDNDSGLITQLSQTYQEEFCLYYVPTMFKVAQKYQQEGVRIQCFTPIQMTRYFGHLKGTAVVLVDNYFAEIAALKKSYVIQLWHATGAIKRFGWGDSETRTRSKSAQRRFQKVYNQLDEIVVGSKRMGEIFCQSYHVSETKISYLGTPRTDCFTSQSPEEKISENRIFAYVPTYRKTTVELKCVLTQALATFASLPQYSFIVKLHPTVLQQLDLTVPANVELTIEGLPLLFKKVGGLITDYSSSVFDFYLNAPKKDIFFFCPDFATYQKNPGLQADFVALKEINALLFTTEELRASLLNHQQENNQQLANYLKQWHDKNDGKVVPRLLAEVQQKLN